MRRRTSCWLEDHSKRQEKRDGTVEQLSVGSCNPEVCKCADLTACRCAAMVDVLRRQAGVDHDFVSRGHGSEHTEVGEAWLVRIVPRVAARNTQGTKTVCYPLPAVLDN